MQPKIHEKPKPILSVKKSYFMPDENRRGIGPGLSIPADYNEASDYRYDLKERVFMGYQIEPADIKPGGNYLFGDGSVSAPSIAFANDTDAGWYRIGSNNVGMTLGAVKTWDYGASVGFTTADFGVGATPTARLHVTQAASTSGTPNPAFKITGAAHTGLAGSEAIDIDLNLARTVTFGTGFTTQRAVYLRRPTYSSSGALTITNAATLAIQGAPAEAGSIALTWRYALWVEGGRSRFDETVYFKDGGPTDVGIAFESDDLANDLAAKTGFYRIGANEVGVAANGIRAMSVAALSTTADSARVYTEGTFGAGASPVNARCYVTGPAQTGSTHITTFKVVGPAHTWSDAAEHVEVDFDIDPTVQFAGGFTTQRAFVVRAPTYSSSVVATTITNAATVAITGAPTAGTNTTITNAYALWVQAGKTQMDGNAAVGGTFVVTGAATLNGGLTVTGTTTLNTALGIASGGTGQTTATAAFDALAPTTTKGDLIAHDGSDNVRVAVGTDGYRLQADSAATPGVAWKATDIGCRIKRTTAQTIANDTVTAVAFDATDEYDTDTMHDTVTNNNRITFNTAGKYIVGTSIRWTANATGYRSVLIRINGVTGIVQSRLMAVTDASVATDQNVELIYNFAANDYIEVMVRQLSGGNLDVAAANDVSARAWAQKVDRGG